MAAPGAHVPYPHMPAQSAPPPFSPAPVYQPYTYAMHPGMAMYGQHPATAMHQLPPHAVSVPPHNSNPRSHPSATASAATSKRKKGGAKPNRVRAKSKTAGGGFESDEDGDGEEGECCHNHWDNIRVKKGVVTLACRFCSAKWKLAHPLDNKCPDFYRGFCPFGPHCPFLHIHRFKSKTKSPDPPNYFEGGIAKDCDFTAVVRSILEKHQGDEAGKSPTAVYEEVIVAYAVKQQRERGGPSAIVIQNPTEASPNSHSGEATTADYVVPHTRPEAVVASSVAPAPAVQVAPAPQQPPPADVDPFADDFGLQPLKMPKKEEEPVLNNRATSAGSRIAVSPAVAHGLKTPGSAVAPGTPITRQFVSSMREIDAENKKRSSVPSTPNPTPHTPGTGPPLANRSLGAVPLTPGSMAPDFGNTVMSGIPPSPGPGGGQSPYTSHQMADSWCNSGPGSQPPSPAAPRNRPPGPYPQQHQQPHGKQQHQQKM